MTEKKQRQTNPNSLANLEKRKPFVPGDPRIHKTGTPQKYVNTLGIEGYSLLQLNDCIQQLLAANEPTLEAVSTNMDATVLERTVAKALLKDMRGSHLDAIGVLVDRVFGKPKIDVGIDMTARIDHFHHVPLDVDRNLMMQIVLGKIAARGGLDVSKMTALLNESYYSKTIDIEATVVDGKPLPSDMNYSVEEKAREADESKRLESESIEDMLKRQLTEKLNAIRGEKKPLETAKQSMKDKILGKR